MQATEWLQFIRNGLPDALVVRVAPKQSFPVWVRPTAESGGGRVTFAVAFDGEKGDVQEWDVDMVESVLEDASYDGEIETVPVEETPFEM
jgi:hypothetical protein